MSNKVDEKQIRDIGSIQLDSKFQEYLRASTYLYLQAKRIVLFQFIFTVVIPIGFTILAIIFTDFKVWAAFFGIVFTLLDLAFFDKVLKDKKKEGAKVQECFDCDLLLMNWNDFKIGSKPEPETIHQAAKSLKRELTDGERNWYSKSQSILPLYLSRLVCQRESIWWDKTIRRKYVNYLTAMGVIIAILAIAIGVEKRSMEFLILTILAPIFPTLVWLIKEIKKQLETISLLDRLMQNVEKLWNRALDEKADPEDIANKSRELQDELFAHRSSNQPIPNRIHKHLSKGFNPTMNIGAEDLVKYAISKIK